MAFDKMKPADTETFGNAPGVIRTNQDAVATHHRGTTSPASPDEGYIWVDSNTSPAKIKVYENGAWVLIGTMIDEIVEVITARGSKSTLDGRLDVSLNEDGTLKSGVSGGNEWVDGGFTEAYVSGTQFTVNGDQTDVFTWGRRIKATLTSGAVYGTVKSSTYGTETTVTLFESVLDATLSLVEHSFISNDASGSKPRERMLAPVADVASLPTTGNENGDARVVLVNFQTYNWNDTDKAWHLAGRGIWQANAQATPDMTVRVRPGIGYVGSTLVEKTAAANSPTVTAPTTNPRIDVLVMDNTGAISWVTGTEAASPSPPTYPTDKLSICEIYMRTGSTAIYNTDQGSHGYIKRDVRPFLNMGGGTTTLGQDRNLVIKTATAATVDIDADELVVEGYRLTGVNLTADITGSGANGLDTTPTEAADTLYYLWVIYDPDTPVKASLLSLSATSPTMPSGYTKKRLVGAARNDASSNLLNFTQSGENYEFELPIQIYSASPVTGGDKSLSAYVMTGAQVADMLAMARTAENGTNNQRYRVLVGRGGVSTSDHVIVQAGPGNNFGGAYTLDAYGAGLVPLDSSLNVYFRGDLSMGSAAKTGTLWLKGYKVPL